jgi:hypothetical protein
VPTANQPRPPPEPIPGVPRDYRIILPDGWFRIALEPGERERSARALADRQFHGLDNAPATKARLRDQLIRQAEAAWQAGGIELYLSLQQAAGLPLAASLLITLIAPPPDGPVTPAQLAEASAAPGRTVTRTTLPAGPAVRVRRRTIPTPGDLRTASPTDPGGPTSPDHPAPPVTNLDIHLQVPGSGAYLLLSFATPLDPLATPMTLLFDAIAATLHWIP